MEYYLKAGVAVESWLKLEVHIDVGQAGCSCSELSIKNPRGEGAELLHEYVKCSDRQHVQQVWVIACKAVHHSLGRRAAIVCIKGAALSCCAQRHSTNSVHTARLSIRVKMIQNDQQRWLHAPW